MFGRKNIGVWDREFARADQMLRLFKNFFKDEPFWSNKPLFPHIPMDKELALINYIEPLTDVAETEKEIITKIEIPGVDKEDIRISAANEGIEITAEKRDEIKEEDRKKGRYRIERSYSGFYRYFSLPEYADFDKVEASYKNGILELRIPKTGREAKKGKEIKVK